MKIGNQWTANLYHKITITVLVRNFFFFFFLSTFIIKSNVFDGFQNKHAVY